MAKNNSDYTEESIQVLEGLEAVRKRPGMYIGNIDTRGLHHLVWEVVDNSIDEVLAGYATNIKVVLEKDESITISDNGRGIPTAIHPKTQISTLETVFTILHAGGKFGGENSGYKASGGLHGVGASVVNALSEWLVVNVHKNGKHYKLEFKNGGQKVEDLIEIGPTNETGTKVSFKPDFSIFNKDVGTFDLEIIRNRLKEMAYLNKGLSIVLIDRRPDAEYEEEFVFANGVLDFVKDLNAGYEKIHEYIITSESDVDNVQVEIAMQYTSSYQPRILSFVNNIITNEGGTHVQGFLDGVVKNINDYAKKTLPQKERETFSREDVKEGLIAIISIKHTNPMYEGQTKNKFANIEVRKIVNKAISSSLERFLLENPPQAAKILTKVKLAAKSRIAALKAKEVTRRKDVLEFSTLPGKLADASSKDASITELFIVEGDSAGGSAKMGRDREIQAILPLRGKVINSERARIDKLFANNEITSIITALGTGIGEEFDISKIRYGKIVIMTDADVDGSHIRTLLLTFFYRYFRELIEQGYLYIAQPPLFKIWKGKDEYYAYTDDEKDKIFEKLGNNLSSYFVQRYKGLGEMNDEQLWETTMDPERRKLLKISIGDSTETDLVFSNLMGEIVNPRKEFIIKNSKFAKLDI